MNENHPLLVVLPRLADGRIILLHRADQAGGPGRWTLPSCPLPPAEALAQTAADLLHRTTDYVPGRLVALGRFHGPEPVHCYLADELRPSLLPPVLAPMEMVSPVEPDELRRLIGRGAPCCGTLLSALTLLSAAVL